MKDVLVIDIGGTHVKFAATEGGSQRELGRHFPTASLRDSDPVKALAAMIEEVCGELDFRPDAVVSTVPGFLDPNLDLVHYAGNIQTLNGRRLATELGARIGVPVHLERDAILLLRGEWFAGAGKDADHLLGIFFGTGVGVAFLQNGCPFRGSGFAMEIGSMPFKGLGRTLEGRRPDCLETYVSGKVLETIAEQHATPIEEVFVAADVHPALRADVDGFVDDMAMVVAQSVAMLSPDTTIIGGGICNMKGFPSERLARRIEEIAPVAETGSPLNLKWAALGWKAAMHGAALRAEEEAARRASEPDVPEGRTVQDFRE